MRSVKVRAWALVGSNIASHEFGTNGPLAIYRRRHHAKKWSDLRLVRVTITFDKPVTVPGKVVAVRSVKVRKELLWCLAHRRSGLHWAHLASSRARLLHLIRSYLRLDGNYYAARVEVREIVKAPPPRRGRRKK